MEKLPLFEVTKGIVLNESKYGAAVNFETGEMDLSDCSNVKVNYFGKLQSSGGLSVVLHKSLHSMVVWNEIVYCADASSFYAVFEDKIIFDYAIAVVPGTITAGALGVYFVSNGVVYTFNGVTVVAVSRGSVSGLPDKTYRSIPTYTKAFQRNRLFTVSGKYLAYSEAFRPTVFSSGGYITHSDILLDGCAFNGTVVVATKDTVYIYYGDDIKEPKSIIKHHAKYVKNSLAVGTYEGMECAYLVTNYGIGIVVEGNVKYLTGERFKNFNGEITCSVCEPEYYIAFGSTSVTMSLSSKGITYFDSTAIAATYNDVVLQSTEDVLCASTGTPDEQDSFFLTAPVTRGGKLLKPCVLYITGEFSNDISLAFIGSNGLTSTNFVPSGRHERLKVVIPSAWLGAAIRMRLETKGSWSLQSLMLYLRER